MKLSIVKGEAIRCLRNSTDKVAWLSALHKIFQGLIARGYDGRDIKRKWKQVRWEQRRDYLFGENVDSTKPEGTLTLTRYHPDTNKIWRRLIRKHSVPRRLRLKGKRWAMKQQDVRKAWPPVVIFKDFSKLGKFLISSKAAVSDQGGQAKRPNQRRIKMD